jgi:hypothetical protein
MHSRNLGKSGSPGYVAIIGKIVRSRNLMKADVAAISDGGSIR